MRRRTLLVSSAAVLAYRGALAQGAWPTRPVRMLIGYPPGGSTDVTARLLSEPLAKRLRQPVVLDNRAGAGGTLAANTVVRAEPDGYTLLFGASAEMTIAPVTMKAIPYDALADLQAITQVGAVPFFLVVNPGVPANTLAEFIAHAKANAGKLNYSSFGNNTSNHLAGELFKVLTGTNACTFPTRAAGRRSPTCSRGRCSTRSTRRRRSSSTCGLASCARSPCRGASGSPEHRQVSDVRGGRVAGLLGRHLVRLVLAPGEDAARRGRSHARRGCCAARFSRDRQGFLGSRHRAIGVHAGGVPALHAVRDREMEGPRRQGGHRRRMRPT